MGLDIHAHFEIKVKGKWLHYSQPNIYRNYSLFDKMAMVIGDDEGGMEAKGLPNDIKFLDYDVKILDFYLVIVGGILGNIEMIIQKKLKTSD